MMKLTIQVPGKLFLAGEWAVWEADRTALIGAFDRYVYCEFEAAEAMTVTLPDLKLKGLAGNFADGKFKLAGDISDNHQASVRVVETAIQTGLNYLSAVGKPLAGFSLLIDTVEHALTLADGTIAKVGLGTAPATTVGILGAMLKQAEYELDQTDTRHIIFKLSVLALNEARQQLGHGGDIAACIFGKIVRYRRFDASWLQTQLTGAAPLLALVQDTWPKLLIEPLELPKELQITAAFSGKTADSSAVRQAVESFSVAHPAAYRELIAMIGETTDKLVEAIQSDQQVYVLNLIEAHRLCQVELGKQAGVEMETEFLAKLTEIAGKYDGAGKLSGTGGGNSGIAVCFDQFVKEDIEWAWEEAGLYPLDVFVSNKGVSVWF